MMNVSIIVPCKNEEKNIVSVVNSLQPIGKRTEVLFGNDQSEDNTEGEIKRFIKKRKDLDIIYYEGREFVKQIMFTKVLI